MELKDIVAPLLLWYRSHARDLPWRKNITPYRTWISEIMLQQTRVDTVIPYYLRFLDELPDIASLASVPEERLLKLWEGLGYYSRAKNLQKAAQVIMEKHQGVFPGSYAEILALPGIGEYTAGAVSSIAFGQPYPAVDGNVLRVITRLTGNFGNISDPAVKASIRDELQKIYPAESCGNFTQALMELGAVVCVPNGPPVCGNCPSRHLCTAYAGKLTAELPVRQPPRAKRNENKTVLLISCGSKIALCKRQGKGVLAGMWSFPMLENHCSSADAAAFLEKSGFEILDIRQGENRKHVFTHLIWNMQCFCCAVKNMPESFHWFSAGSLLNDLSMPTAFRQFQKQLPEEWF